MKRAWRVIPILMVAVGAWLLSPPPVARAAAPVPPTPGATPTAASIVRLQLPFSDPVDVTQPFGPTPYRAEPPYAGYPHFHIGIDFALPMGTEIVAAAAGQVVQAGWDTTGFGNRVVLDHGHGVQTLYGHLDHVDVMVGDVVQAGQRIGLSGNSGNSSGPHLHFGVMADGSWVDPAPALAGGVAGSATATGAITGTGGPLGAFPPAPHIGPTCAWTDPGTWMPCFTAGLLNIVSTWVGDAVDTVSIANVWSNTDSRLTDANPTVVRYYTASRVIADACLGGIALGIIVEIYMSFKAGRLFDAAIERFWRVALVAMVANGALPVIGDALYLANLATQAMDVAQQAHLISIATQSPVGASEATWMLVVLFIVNGIMGILLFVQMLMRIGLLDVLIVLSPLGMMCYAWGRLHFWAELWGRLFVATLITQFVQVAALHMGEDLVTDAPATFITSLNPTLLPLSTVKITVQDLVAIAVFVVVLRVPKMLRGQGHGPGLGGIILAVKAAKTAGVL